MMISDSRTGLCLYKILRMERRMLSSRILRNYQHNRKDSPAFANKATEVRIEQELKRMTEELTVQCIS